VKGVEQLLAELREHGTIDSQGEFTLSLSEARRKLVQYHSSEQARYLLLLLSAGTAAGATSLTVRQSAHFCRLEMPGAYLPESALLSAFDGQTPQAAASDLVLGLQGAFLCRAERVEVKAQRPGESFLWTMERDSEQSVPIDFEGAVGIEISLHYKQGVVDKLRGVLGRLRGYAARSPEARLIDAYCDRSLIPIIYNDERSDRPLFLPPGALAQVGDLGDKKLEFKTNFQLHLEGWRGVLALGAGAVQIVIHGVAYCQIEDLGLAGTVYHDGLERDLSREKVVRDQTYDQLVADLEKVRVDLCNRLVGILDQVSWPLIQQQLPDLVYLFLTRGLLTDNRQALWEWMVAEYQRRDGGRRFEPSPRGLMDLMVGLLKDAGARERVLHTLLADCGDGARQRAPNLHKKLDVTHELFRSFHPEETLVLGYLLLGLGAVHSLEGRKNDSERAWFKSLETVWAGSDARAQELMYGHMAFSPEHILRETASALSMYCVSGV
jgi:hypothetical protein